MNPRMTIEEEVTDRISSLPDHLIHRILSFLETEKVAETSLLCKRWRPLWNSIPVLKFTEPPPTKANADAKRSMKEKANTLMNFIEKALLHNNSTILQFHLYCDEYFDPYRLYSCLSHILQKHKIQEINLSFHPILRGIELPSHLFTSASLVSLELTMSRDFKLPSSIYFPRLKKLSLKLVTFSVQYSTEQPFSNCPVLEYLYLEDCKWVYLDDCGLVSITTLNISLPSLKYLWLYDDIPSLGECEIKLSLPNLVELCLDLNIPKSFELYNNKSFFHNACIGININRKYTKEDIKMLFEPLSDVQELDISKNIGQVIFYDDEFLPTIPKFENLTKLNLEYWEPQCVAFTTLLNILQVVPNLQDLAVHEVKFELKNDYRRRVRTGPLALLQHLKLITIMEIRQSKSQLEMIEFLLENASVIEDIYVGCEWNMAKKLLEWAKKFTLLSTKCNIHICPVHLHPTLREDLEMVRECCKFQTRMAKCVICNHWNYKI